MASFRTLQARLGATIVAAAGASALPATSARAELRVLKTGGEPAAAHEATRTLDPDTGEWDVHLKALYAPGDWTRYDVVGDAGETIDELVIDVPCMRRDGQCVPAGSPVIVRVISDGPEGVRTVRRIVQTGTAETILNTVTVREDIGAVEVEVIGILYAGRDVLGPVVSTTANNPTRGINTVEAAGHIRGDVTAEQGRIIFVYAHGELGARGARAAVRAKHGVIQVAGLEGVYADINTRVNGGAGRLFALGGGCFDGTLETEALFANPFNNWPARINFDDGFAGRIVIGRSFDDPAQWFDVPARGLAAQVIINADAHTGGTWAAPIHVGVADDPDRIVLSGPGYAETADAIGGGSVGVVPFRLHGTSCVPPAGGDAETGNGPIAVRLRHYGPVRVAGPAPVAIARRDVDSDDPFVGMPLDDFTVRVADDDPNTLEIAGFEKGAEYRVTPTADLVCDVAAAPPVAWTAPYLFTARRDPCPADVTGDGIVRADDLFAVLAAWGPCKGRETCPEDVDASGWVDFRDLLTILELWGPC